MEHEASLVAWCGEGGDVGWIGPGSELELGSMGGLRGSSKDALDHLTIDIGEAIIPAGMAEGQAFVIQPHQCRIVACKSCMCTLFSDAM